MQRFLNPMPHGNISIKYPLNQIVMRFTLFLLFLCCATRGQTQTSDSAFVDWRGITIPTGKSYADAQVLWLRLPSEQSPIDPQALFLSRQETYQTEFYALHKLMVKHEGEEILVEESKAHKKKLNRGTSFCRMTYRLKYNEKTGYLEGSYLASDCRGVSGKVIMFRSDLPMSQAHEMTATHAWVRRFIDDLKNNKLSPAKMAEMRNNFEFKPLYFDYDKAQIREEYVSYLKTMAMIVLSHSDLRIKVTGHTDGDGSDSYNLDLSKRRAKAILNFFIGEGLAAERIEIDFRGKREPVAPNSTAEGKQKNRRVDFAFI
jgi:OmpA-OmpF porin, OOP family